MINRWRAGRFEIDLSRPRVMGIVNATPDSFAGDTGAGTARSRLELVDRHLADGADLIDIGGESTRPGAPAVSADVELARILPVLRHAVRLGVPVSVDTRKVAVMRAALAEGADIINDVQALQAAGAEELLAEQSDTGICLMHMRGDPESMQQQACYDDVVHEVVGFLQMRVAALVARGVARERIVLDPGFGFAKIAEPQPEPASAAIRAAFAGFAVAGGLVQEVHAGHNHRPAGTRARGRQRGCRAGLGGQRRQHRARA